MAPFLITTMYQFVARLSCLWESGPERLSLGGDLRPSPVRRIGQLWIGGQAHIPAVALVTGTL